MIPLYACVAWNPQEMDVCAVIDEVLMEVNDVNMNMLCYVGMKTALYC